jgi:hypothetical protein
MRRTLLREYAQAVDDLAADIEFHKVPTWV